MPFDVFELRDRVVVEYRDYFESFVHIDDPRIRDYARDRLAQGDPWPDAGLQLNPAYQAASSLADLARGGTITAETARFFGENLRLHHHQQDALTVARRGEAYIVTTGTGSGESPTYLVPTFKRKDETRHGEYRTKRVILGIYDAIQWAMEMGTAYNGTIPSSGRLTAAESV